MDSLCKIFELEYFLLIWSLTLFLGLFPAFNSVINLTYFSGFIGYFILGYYLNTKELKQGKILPIALILIGGSITVLGSYLFEDIQWKSYLSPTIVMLSTGVFLFIKNAHLPKLFAIDKLVIKISEYSYGIYLIHAVFISILSRIGVNSLFISPYIGSFILATAVIMISVMFLEVFKRLPFTKNISGL